MSKNLKTLNLKKRRILSHLNLSMPQIAKNAKSATANKEVNMEMRWSRLACSSRKKGSSLRAKLGRARRCQSLLRLLKRQLEVGQKRLELFLAVESKSRREAHYLVVVQQQLPALGQSPQKQASYLEDKHQHRQVAASLDLQVEHLRQHHCLAAKTWLELPRNKRKGAQQEQ